MMPDLSGLRSIHPMIKPDWWPPAVGWWIVSGSIIGLIFIFGIAYAIWYQKPKQYALRTLKSIYQHNQNPVMLARQMSALFKRVALTLYPRREVAGLSAEKWQAFLKEKTFGAFSDEQAKLLAFSTYLPDNTLVPESRNELYRVGQVGIKALFQRKKNGYSKIRS